MRAAAGREMGGRPRARADRRPGREPGLRRSRGGDGSGCVQAAGPGGARGAAAAGARPVPAPPAALPGAHQGGHQVIAREPDQRKAPNEGVRPPALEVLSQSGILSALGNFLAQMIEKKRGKENCSQKLDVSGPLRYAVYGFFFTGPLSHFFYLFMEHWIPSEVPLAGVKRLLLDRLLFAPAFLLLFFLIMSFLEGKDTAAVAVQIRRCFWPALRMNWQVWTPAQFVNINYVPLQFRVLFANLVSLFWYMYLASLGK
ncbi:peroxisomal membrane protein 2 isoform X3 [Meles meles]|uniref:peroxisomal membrane protein 2 isoform X3 n=1 Tax=Meles meles TaxID=9662 RepID=UPI001E69B481|nr:peroxisomal membrane protein 2 isoform X3 [Meles meles]